MVGIGISPCSVRVEFSSRWVGASCLPWLKWIAVQSSTYWKGQPAVKSEHSCPLARVRIKAPSCDRVRLYALLEASAMLKRLETYFEFTRLGTNWRPDR